MKALMVALMAWAAAHTGIPAPDVVPEVKFLEPDRLWYMVRPGQQYRPPQRRGDQRIAGAYRADIIYLEEGWDTRDLADVSFLLHELVHHMQDHARLSYRCRGRHERPAYDAQIAWIEAAGADPWQILDMNPLFYVLVTSCPAGHGAGGGQ